MNKFLMNDSHKGALRELANICIGHTATALSQKLNKHIAIDIPELKVCSLNTLLEKAGAKNNTVALTVQVSGDFIGYFVLMFSQINVLKLNTIKSEILNYKIKSITEHGHAVIEEIGGALIQTYLTILADFIKINLTPSAPQLVEGDVFKIFNTSFTKWWGAASKKRFIIKSELKESLSGASGDFLFVFDANGLKILLDKLGP